MVAAAAVPYSALGDPAASLVGTRFGHVRFWGRSLEGHLACLAVYRAIAAILSVTQRGLPFWVAASQAAVATVIQAVNLPVNDNITIPLGSGLVMWALERFAA